MYGNDLKSIDEDLLAQAIELLKAGETEDGKMLLLQYVRGNSSNEAAWLWLATVLDGKHRIDCLEWALKVNPQNERTREFLLKLNPHGGYEDPYWQKVNYVLSSIPEPEEIPVFPQEFQFPEGEVVFKPSKALAFRVSLTVTFVIFSGLLYVLFKEGIQLAWDIYILLSFGICFLFFIISYLMQIINFFEITVTKTHLIVKEPVIRFTSKPRAIPIEDILVEESVNEKLIDSELYTQNWGSVKLGQLHAKQVYELIALINHRQKKYTRHGSKIPIHDANEEDPQVLFESVKQKPLYKGALPRGTVNIKPKAGYVFLMTMVPFLIFFVIFSLLFLIVDDFDFLNILKLMFWDGLFSFVLFVFLCSSIYQVKITQTHVVGIADIQFPLMPASLKIEDVDLRLSRAFESEWWGYTVGSYHGKRIYLLNMDERKFELILRIIEDRQNRLNMKKQLDLQEEIDHFFD